MSFDYHEAFSRNIGLVTREEQETLKSKKIAIAGMGGVGGFHLLTLSRLGIGSFNIADMDHYELANFNRQVGASMSTVGKEKTAVMKNYAQDINPDCDITVFSNGVNEENIDAFLDGVDLYIDGLDFYVLGIRAMVFKKCNEKGIPCITAGPIGCSTAYLVFDPNGMSFEEYFQFEGKNETEMAAHFLTGLTPRIAQKNHFMPGSINFGKKKGASLAPACMASSAVIGAESMKILLGRGKVQYAPWSTQFDMLNNKYHKVYNFMGNKNPINKFKIRRLLKAFKG